MRRSFPALLVCAVASFLASALHAQSTWTGAVDASWHDPGNWSAGSVPTSTTDVVIPAVATLPSIYTADPVCRSLEVRSAATLTLSGGYDLFASGSVTVQAGGTLALGGSDASVAASFTASGAGAVVSGSGWIVLTGTGTFSTLTNTVPNLRVQSAGTASFATSAVQGDLELVSGTLLIGGGVTVTVGGDARLSGGTLSWETAAVNLEMLDIAGDATLSCAAGPCNLYNRIYCAGSWSSTSAWAPANDMYVVLDGAGSFTISGTSPRFPRLVIDAGTYTLQSGAQVQNAFTISTGASLVCNAVLDAQSGVTLGGASSTWDLGNLTHTIAGSYTSTGGSAIGTGWIQCDGTGTVTTGTGTIANLRVNTSGTVAFATSRVSGDLELVSGTLLIGGGATVTVDGDARLSNGTLAWETASMNVETLDIAGDATLSCAAGPCNVYNRLFCAGSWSSTSAWAPVNDMYVVLDGAGSFAISGTDPRFPRLAIEAGTYTLQSAAQVKHALTIAAGATLVCNAVLDVDGSATIAGATATWDLGSLTHTVGTSYTSAGGSAIGTGWILCDGAGTVTTGTGTIANLRVNTSGTVTISTSRVSGDLELLAGTLLIADDVNVAVGGDARLYAPGIFGYGPPTTGPETLDVAGDVTITALTGASSAENRLRCGGTWTGDGAWSPSVGTVYLYGVGAHDIAGVAPSFPNLMIERGPYTLLANGVVKGGLWISSGGALIGAASFDVAGTVTLGDATASWDLGGFTHTVAGGFSSSGGSATGSGWILCDGTGTVATGSGTIANLRVGTSGTVTISTSRVSGDLELVSGTLAIGGGATVTVDGDARLSSGTLAWETASINVETFDIAGDATLTCAAGPCNVYNRIYCAGNWSSTSAWAPASDMYVVLDGAGSYSITGTDPRFPRLAIEAGIYSLQSAALAKHALTIAAGASLICNAVLDVDGSVAIAGATATWDLGNLTHTVGASYTSTGGHAIGTGWIQCDGTGTVTTGTGTIANLRVSTSGTVTISTTRVSGDLELVSGTLLIGGGATVTVDGEALLSSGTLAWETASVNVETLDIAGDATLTCAAGPCNVYNRIYCAGSWSSSSAWSPANDMYVVLDGAGSFAITGADPRFPRLVIDAGTRTLQSAARVQNALTISTGATLVCSAVLDVQGSVALGGSTATWDLGNLTHTVGTSYTSAGGSAIGTGWIECDGAGTVTTGTGTIANLRVSTSGTVAISTSRVSGDLELLAGTLLIADDVNVVVEGDARLYAPGIFGYGPPTTGPETLDVAGDVTITALTGASSAENRLRCGGTWTGDGAWSPSVGTVYLYGVGAHDIAGVAPSFPNLMIERGPYTLLANGVVKGGLWISSGGALIGAASFDVTGTVTLGDATASWDLGGFTHTVAGGWSSSGGSATGSGWILCDGTGTVATGAGTIANLRVGTSGTVALSNSHLTGDLELVNGTLAISGGATVTVDGDARLSNGTLAWETASMNVETLDIAGDAAVCCVAGPSNQYNRIYCAGSWSSNGTWAPGGGLAVHLDGASATAIAGLAPTFDPRFSTLILENAERFAAGDFDLQATSFSIASGGALRIEGQRVSVTAPSFQVQGALRVGAGGTLELDATTQVSVLATGTLRCVGTTSAPAVVSGRSGGGYGLLVSGRLEAMNFLFAQMGAAGIRIASSAVIAAAPEDLRNGTFREGSATAGACLLDLARVSGIELRYLRFENAGTATYNLRSATFAPIRLVNWSGSFSGSAFEDDPNGVIEWSAPEATELGSFSSLGAVQRVEIAFDTISESADVVAFHVLRAESAGGPFTEIAGSPLTPIGDPTTPASYALVDDGLVEYTRYFYKLEEELSHGGRRELATDAARPWPTAMGDAVFVGPNGYATPAAAFAAVPSGGTIVVAGGTYPSFEIDRPVIVVPATSEPVVIDTASAPLVIRDVASGLVALYGLRIGAGAGSHGVEALRCDAVVVLDGLTIDADPARDALRLDACSRAAVQSCVLGAGAIGRTRNATRAHWSGGSVGALVLESGAVVDTCGVIPGSVSVDPGCTHRALPGTMPRLDNALVGRSDRAQRFRVAGDPFAPFTLYFALGDGYLDLSAVLPIDMVLLLDIGLMAPFASGALSPTGEVEIALTVPAEPLLWGYRLPFQALVVRGAALRFSNVRHVVLVP